MVSTAAISLVVSVFVFFVLLLGVRKETLREKRFFAVGIRSWFDVKIDVAGEVIVRSWSHFVKYIVQLNWYYSIHSLLRTLLRVLVAFYTYFENIFEKNRLRTKQLRAEKRGIKRDGHLAQVAEHKEGIALTEVEKRKLKKRKLEESN